MSYCSPNINIKNHYTCFDYDELKQIALALNIYIQKNMLCEILGKNTKKSTVNCSKKIIDINKKTKKQLWYSIYNRLKTICPYEYCWVDLKFIDELNDNYLKEKIREFTFKPKITKDYNSWLYTQDINNVLQQYQEVDKSFKFLGALPCDFHKIIPVDYSKINDYSKFAIVFNLDNHTQPGSHWVSFLIDNDTKTLEYYDSGGKLPNKNIREFIEKTKKYLNKNNNKYLNRSQASVSARYLTDAEPIGSARYRILYNKKRQQYENIECGMYAMYFIIQRLLGDSFEKITNSTILDKDMNRFRRIVFRPLSKNK